MRSLNSISESVAFLLGFAAPMPGVVGCRKAADPVLASFLNTEFSTNRIVLYTTGRYELYGADDDGRLKDHAYEAGTFVGTGSTYVVSVDKGILDSPAMRARKQFRIVHHGGVEYLFDERGSALRKFEATKDERELRHGWRREESQPQRKPGGE